MNAKKANAIVGHIIDHGRSCPMVLCVIGTLLESSVLFWAPSFKKGLELDSLYR
jgi:hypothetical protein